MAVEICVALRRSEFTALTVEMILIDAENIIIELLISDSASKVRKVQLGLIKDERAIRMLLHLIAENKLALYFIPTGKKAYQTQSYIAPYLVQVKSRRSTSR